jgi:hypothetical protein
MTSAEKPAVAGTIACLVMLVALAAIAPVAANGQTKPTVTVVNPVSNPVNARITNSVVPVEVSNTDPIPVSLQDAGTDEFTHVGQKPSRLVSLNLNRDAGSRIEPQNGNGTDFVVPAGFLFVLTDIQWEAACSPDNLINFTLVRHQVSGTFDRPVRGSAMCHGGSAHFERHYTTGEVFGEEQSFTVDAVFGLSATPTVGVFAEAHGYLVPAD